ncbi:hypothetical protein DDR33_11195 [Pararcticibacter amylolyticus]|uniref:Uncharacterized protein n=1 Tax=Pararcticibacter amylolyticus TaxID=2173175 RepID=A0A2U2PHH7_9SPHI|nr:hypothetical protein DDR33_11195 [Pararcticibacter amylolyticus]
MSLRKTTTSLKKMITMLLLCSYCRRLRGGSSGIIAPGRCTGSELYYMKCALLSIKTACMVRQLYQAESRVFR